ncbi:cell division protein FtsK [Fibrobacter sp. UWB1]|uniref:FtsK/SpoIIIE family DNA translocase n=1 Tax=Fibrobacter sp. UWB1 TaxID=1964355 RepID=UPI000B51FBE1|nr:DNA translocase FtsK [Fibrobacter sp. UWB1]OWV26068.1 cell division protein FtsK [Fibrobacter sp. UWB1]
MATQKKSSSKKSGKSAKSSKKDDFETSEQGFGAILGGWALVGFGTILMIGCICSAYSGVRENVLGPYLGKMFPDALAFVFGRVASLFVSSALVLWGAALVSVSRRMRFIRYAVGLTLLSVIISFLCSLRNYGETKVAKNMLMQGGGAFGQFFNQFVAVPIFGKASLLMPLTISLVGIALILVIAFGLRPRHFKFVVQTTAWLKSVFKKKEPIEGEVYEPVDTRRMPQVQTNMDLGGLPRGVYMDDNTVNIQPDGFKIRRKNKVTPFNGRSNWMDDEFSLNGTTDEVPNLPDEVLQIVTPRRAKEMAPQPDSTNNMVGGYNLDEDPEIRRLEDYLRQNGGKMNALEIVEVKEKIAALKRARDLIAWEKDHRGRMQVKGDVRREGTPVTGSMATRTVAGSVMPTGTQPAAKGATQRSMTQVHAQNADERTVMAGEPTVGNEAPFNAEDLLGGDGAADDTFVPEVYGADDVGYVPEMPDETLGASIGNVPNGTSTAGMKAAPIPQRDPTTVYDEYKVPAISDILEEHEPQTADYSEEELNAIGKMLEEKLENFKVKGRVIGCETGPMITRFEVEPGPGMKVSRFSALQEDLALPLKVSSVRILAPIPGKAAVGIEIPNRKFQTVYCLDVFQSEKFKPSPEKILVALGKDITGEAFTMDLAKAPHLLIAGQTGSGKSVCINALMASMLFSKTPDELRMILVDPKAVELKMYENIPHLLAPVITKPEIAIQALQWLCYEMDRRTEVLASAKVRNIGGFNAKFEAGELPDEVPEEDRSHRMAFIVVIIDEMADLMMVAGKEIEKNVARLAAKARAVGIHLVLATQRPSVKVITGIIKANLPTRISFKVASQIDARTVMDHAGAEKLLGRGDMLYKAVNDPEPVRVHGAFLSDEEAEKLADACSDQNVFYPQVESFDVSDGEGDEDGEGGGKDLGKLDKLLYDVAVWAVECRGLSTSAVQRHFSVGFSRAGKIVDQLYSLGVCGPAKGNSKPRAMLLGIEEIQSMQRSGKFG